MIGGNIFHGELSLEQLFHMRPAPGYADYRTPIAGLYNGSSGTHAGGGVCGIPGWQAARAALADKKRGRRFRRAPEHRPAMDAARRAAVAAMLGARSMAVVGASPRPDSFGSRMVLEAQRGSARVHLVNPRYDRIGELPCAPSLADLDEAVDLVLLGVPDAALVGATGGRRGDGCAVGGAVRFRARPAREDHGDGDRRRNGAVRGGLHGLREQRARGAGAGVPGAGSVAAGGISLVTHSGSAFSTLLRARRGFGFRLAVSSGSGTRHRHRRLRGLRARRSRDPDHRAVDGDAALGPAAAAGAAARRRAGRAGGDPHRRRLAARPGDGRRALGRAGR